MFFDGVGGGGTVPKTAKKWVILNLFLFYSGTNTVSYLKKAKHSETLKNLDLENQICT